MICTKCGAQNAPEAQFCRNCGFRFAVPSSGGKKDFRQGGAVSGAPAFNSSGPAPSFSEMSFWQFLLFDVLFLLPGINLILSVLFGFILRRNRTLTNFSRAVFCILVVLSAAACVYIFLFGGRQTVVDCFNAVKDIVMK